MEIQIGNVNFQPTKTGKDKWVVATNEGNLSVWDGEMAEQLNKLVGKIVNVEVRQPAPNTNYLPTITKVDFDSAVKQKPAVFGPNAVHYQEVHDGVRSVNGEEQLTVEAEQIFKQVKGAVANSDRNKSIIAQCLVKAVIGQYPHTKAGLSEDMKGVTICLTVQNAVEMYKEALELLG